MPFSEELKNATRHFAGSRFHHTFGCLGWGRLVFFRDAQPAGVEIC